MSDRKKLSLLLVSLSTLTIVALTIFIGSQQEAREKLEAARGETPSQHEGGEGSGPRRNTSLLHVSGFGESRADVGLATSEFEVPAATSDITSARKPRTLDLVGRLVGFPEFFNPEEYLVELVYRRQYWKSGKAHDSDFMRALGSLKSAESITADLAFDSTFEFKGVTVGKFVSVCVKHRHDGIEPVSTVSSFRVAESNSEIELETTRLRSVELDFGGAVLPCPKMKVILTPEGHTRGYALQLLTPSLPSGDGCHVRTIPESGRIHIHGIASGCYQLILVSDEVEIEYEITQWEVFIDPVDLKPWFAETIKVGDRSSTRLSIGEVHAPASFTVTDVQASGLEVRRQYHSGGEAPGFRRAPYDGQIMVAGIAPGNYKFRLLYGPMKSWGKDVGPWIRLRLNSGQNIYHAKILER